LEEQIYAPLFFFNSFIFSRRRISMKKVTMKFDGITVLNIAGYDDGYYWDTRITYKYKDHIFEYIDCGSGSGYIPPYEGISMLASPDEELAKDWNEEFVLMDTELLWRLDAKTLIAAAEFLLKTGSDGEDLYYDPYEYGGQIDKSRFDQKGYLVAYKDFVTDHYDIETPEFNEWCKKEHVC
jgi:hypothetical protein